MTSTLTAGQINEFLEQGIVTINTPLSPTELVGATAALDRVAPFYLPDAPDAPRYRAGASILEPEVIDIVQHPFFENVARDILRADVVRLFQAVGIIAYPEPDIPFSFDQHVDIQYRLSDFEATPRRIVCSFFLWLTDVNEHRAPMMFRRGSHLLLARENERIASDALRVVKGSALAQLPSLEYSEPVPITARAGQVSVLTTSAIHGGSTNVDDTPRKAMIITFVADGVKISLSPEQLEQKRSHDNIMRSLLRPDRRHILQ